MDTLAFFCYDLEEHRPKASTFLFNRAEHLFLQSKKGWRVYGLQNGKSGKVVAQICFNIKGKELVSPLQAPFGSLEVYEHIGQEKIEELFIKIEEEVKVLGITHWRIKSYPKDYDSFITSMLQKALSKLNFNLIEEISSIIPVDQKLFEKRIRVSQRQKLRKSEKRFAFSQVKLTELSKIYSFIRSCRKKKSQTLSMPLFQLQKVADLFPRKFILFQVADGNQVAAAAIVIKVSEKILYTFYYSHDKRFDKISPVVLLISGIYQYAQQRNFTHIDLGTSMVNGGVNRPLLQFKKSIGGHPSSKYIFEKTLS
ncbi:MAG: GNAT family N-acetyltransferase [Bacteroidia bacterium]|nr:GNAT family N-acetyltransferase [Bacteroidia bacterium]